MSEKQQTVALVEVGGSHDECLLTQMHALKEAGCKLLLVCTQELRDRNPQFDQWVDKYCIVDFSASKRRERPEMRRALRWMKAEGVSRAVLNTAHSRAVRKLCVMALFSRIEFIGILHTTRRLQGSGTQKIIHLKIKKYFFLSAYLRSTVQAPKGIKLEYFYPIIFPEVHAPQAHSGINVLILGGVERRRKDLDGFCQMLQATPETIHFTFLGYSNPGHQDVQWLRGELKRLHLENRVTTYDRFVDHHAFALALSHGDWIMPLVHPNTPSADQYFRNQISGAMTVAFAYKIPLLLHEAYQDIDEMKFASSYYSMENFGKALDLKRGAEIRAEMQQLEALNPKFQKQRYCHFVLNT